MKALRTRRNIRLLFAVLIATGMVYLGVAYVTSPESAVGKFERAAAATDQPQVAPRASNDTVIVSDNREVGRLISAVIVLDTNGRVRYYNDTWTNYQDVDPIRGTDSLSVLAAEWLWLRDACPTDVKCSRMHIERHNLTTGHVHSEYREVDASAGSRDWHDADRINDTHYLVGDIGHDQVFIVNVSSGIRVWEWEVRSEYSYRSGGKYPSDWTHLNDVEYLPDGRVMVNLRNQDQVVFLDPGRGLQPNWTLGADDKHTILFEPHNPDYIPRANGGPAVVIADSENNRIVEYQRRNGSWERSWSWSDPRLQWPRDADRLPNGHTLITDTNGGRVIEIDREGDIVWQVNVSLPYEAERLGTGPESTGGPSAVRAGLESRGDTGVTSEETGLREGPVERLVEPFVSLLPSSLIALLYNGLLFLTPPWVRGVELLVGAGIVTTALLWGAVEIRWRFEIGVRTPITVRRR